MAKTTRPVIARLQTFHERGRDKLGHQVGTWRAAGTVRIRLVELSGRAFEHGRQIVQDCTHQIEFLGRIPGHLQAGVRLIVRDQFGLTVVSISKVFPRKGTALATEFKDGR